MILSDDAKKEAKRLGLTQEEARISLAAHIPLARWAFQKDAIQHEREAEIDQAYDVGIALVRHLNTAVIRPGVQQVPLLDDYEE